MACFDTTTWASISYCTKLQGLLLQSVSRERIKSLWVCFSIHFASLFRLGSYLSARSAPPRLWFHSPSLLSVHGSQQQKTCLEVSLAHHGSAWTSFSKDVASTRWFGFNQWTLMTRCVLPCFAQGLFTPIFFWISCFFKIFNPLHWCLLLSLQSTHDYLVYCTFVSELFPFCIDYRLGQNSLK